MIEVCRCGFAFLGDCVIPVHIKNTSVDDSKQLLRQQGQLEK